MNPENNNPLSNSPMPGMDGQNGPAGSGLSMADSMASAEDNLTSAGLAASNNSDILGLDQIGQPEAVMTPPIDEPLVPAAPVPGSIGSVTSVPPLNSDPAAFGAPAMNDGSMNNFATPGVPAAPGAMPESTPVAGFSGGPMSAPEVAPTMPYNPFAQNLSGPEPAKADSTATPNSQNGPALPPVNPSATPTGSKASKSKFNLPKSPVVKTGNNSNILTIILGGVAALMTVLMIIFIILWRQAADNPKIIYMPDTSGETSKGKLEMLTCTQTTDFGQFIDNYYQVSGNRSILAGYVDGKLSSLVSDYSTTYNTTADVEYAQNKFNELNAALISTIGNSFAIKFSSEGTNFVADIESSDSSFSDSDAQILLYGSTDNNPSLSMDDVRAHLENSGFVCSVE